MGWEGVCGEGWAKHSFAGPKFPPSSDAKKLWCDTAHPKGPNLEKNNLACKFPSRREILNLFNLWASREVYDKTLESEKSPRP